MFTLYQHVIDSREDGTVIHPPERTLDPRPLEDVLAEISTEDALLKLVLPRSEAPMLLHLLHRIAEVEPAVTCATRIPGFSAGSRCTASPHIVGDVVLSVDGLTPESYLHPDAHGLAVPNLRTMAAGGAWSDGARSVYPTVTFPSHTTMVTGREPGEHGIVANQIFDPFETLHDALRVYSQDIRVPTLWDASLRAGGGRLHQCRLVFLGAEIRLPRRECRDSTDGLLG